MTDKTMIIKPVAAAVGVAFVSSLAISTVAVADDNPFVAADLDSGYLLAGGDKDKDEGSCGEGSCGDDADEEGSCGGEGDEEGSCGGEGDDEGACGGDKDDEGACGGDGDNS